MPHPTHDNDFDREAQLLAFSQQHWKAVVEERLPNDLEEQARRLHAFRRVRLIP